MVNRALKGRELVEGKIKNIKPRETALILKDFFLAFSGRGFKYSY